MPTVHVVVEAGAVLPLTMRIWRKRSASSSGRLTTREARIVVGNVAALATNWSNNAAYPLDTCTMPMCPGDAVVLIVAVVSPELYPLRWISKFMAVAVAPEYTQRTKFKPNNEHDPLPLVGQPETVNVTVSPLTDAIAYRAGMPASPSIAPMDMNCPTLVAVNGFWPGPNVTVADVAESAVSCRLSPITSTSSTTKLWLIMRWDRIDCHRISRLPSNDSFDRRMTSLFAVVPLVSTRLPPVWLYPMPVPNGPICVNRVGSTPFAAIALENVVRNKRCVRGRALTWFHVPGLTFGIA